MIKRSILRSDIVKMNEVELAIIAKYFKMDAISLHDKAKQLATEFGIKQVIVTAGAQGAWVLADENIIETTAVSSMQAPFIDSVGAGDAFSSVCMVANILNWDHATMINRANEFAGAVCSIRGGAPTDTGFYTPFVNHWNL